MYKQLVFLLLVFGFNYSYSQIPVYEKDMKVGVLHGEISRKCDDCYYWDKENVFGQEIKIKLPVYEMGREESDTVKNYFENQFVVEIKSISTLIKIIKIDNTLSGSSDWLYIQKIKNKLIITQ